MLVLNTISPEVSPSAPKEYPSNTSPSDSARIAFFIPLPLFHSAFRIPHSALEPVPYLPVYIDDFPAHPVPVYRHPDIVVEPSVFFAVVQRGPAAPGDDVQDTVNRLPLIIVFMPREHRVDLPLCKERFQFVPAVRIGVEAVVRVVPLAE